MWINDTMQALNDAPRASKELLAIAVQIIPIFALVVLIDMMALPWQQRFTSRAHRFSFHAIRLSAVLTIIPIEVLLLVRVDASEEDRPKAWVVIGIVGAMMLYACSATLLRVTHSGEMIKVTTYAPSARPIRLRKSAQFRRRQMQSRSRARGRRLGAIGRRLRRWF
jgi:hypothetical protein